MAHSCKDFDDALKGEWEKHGPVVWARTGKYAEWEGGYYRLSADLPPIKFCPWCGEEVGVVPKP